MSPTTFVESCAWPARMRNSVCPPRRQTRPQILNNKLQTRAPVPAVGLDGVGQFDALAGAGRCRDLLRAAPPDAVVHAPVRGDGVKLQVALFDDARLADDSQAPRR